ncbi:hypothetical protein [Nocardia flavorosea]|uniref:Cellulose biosynthesis cyclic di-GMP-binding regulatory protein BcsB n=1 Tax=Nocardia flavorosea TaxID=53429 RepID=A0A846YBN3_9NOCA|nr:hypothetical protein [Nocardia flavorosea]NKY57036.1 cellulose biosynthesis cyclic di-GMP-binding regulatory protein BcsB [Nocardia flavorosea]
MSQDQPPDRPATEPPGRAGATEYFPGERNRVVPRSAWWVLGIALAVLVSFVFLRPEWFTRDADDKSLDVPADRHFTKTLAGSGHADGAWLTDDSPSTSFLVRLPADSAREETRLHLTGSSQVAADSTVFLSVSMDGQQVYEQRLSTGEHGIDAYIAIPDQIAGDGRVRIRIHAEGTRHGETCTPDHSAGMQIHLGSDSVVEAALTEPLHTVRDVVASWDRRVTIVPADPGIPWRTTAAQLGMALIRSGHEVSFAETPPDTDVGDAILVGPAATLADRYRWTPLGISGPGIAAGTVGDNTALGVTTPDGTLVSQYLTETVVSTADSAISDPAAVTTTPRPAGDEVSLESLGADMSAAQITEARRWHLRYSLSDLPGGRIPRAVRVEMQLPASPPDLTWLLNVELNGRLVGSRPLNPTAGTVRVELPPQDALLGNTLTLSVARDRNLGGCDVRVTSYPIQLKPGAALELGDDPGAGFTALPRAFAPGFAIYLPDDGGNPVQQLDAVVPVLTEFVPAQYTPEFRWGQQPSGDAPFILVGRSPDVVAPASIQDGRMVAGPGGSILNIPAFDNGLLVEVVTSGGQMPGLMVQHTGHIVEAQLPDFGREAAVVVTEQGSFAVGADGSVLPATPVREMSPR